MRIILIAQTQVLWEVFVLSCNKIIGRSPTRSLDRENIPVGETNIFPAALNEFMYSSSNPREIRNNLLEHISLTLLISLHQDDYIQLIEVSNQKLSFVRCKDSNSKDVNIIVSGNLRNWKEVITSNNITQLWSYFHKLGYSEIFLEYKINEHQQIELRS